MGASPRKPTAATETPSRDRILDAAEELFASRGFGATSTRLIARHAGVNIALLYYYFESKEGLYKALMERYTGHFAGVLEGVLAAEGSTRTRIEKAIDALFDYLGSNTRFIRILVREALAGQQSEHARAAQAYLRAILAAGEAVLMRGAAQGAVRIVDAQMFLLHVYAASVFYFAAHANLKLLLDGDPLEPENALRAREEIKAMVLARLGLPLAAEEASDGDDEGEESQKH
ncbi:MAG TPA: TetR/AcrR family transcriptional regulator [Polyangia bacterium]|nr:TetR/AcrR family transcriptional regulator [Polyangia bacterium]